MYLTSRDNPSQTFYIRARALSGFAALVESLGGDPRALLAAVGIPAMALEDPESTLPLNQLVQLLNLSARQLGLPDLGLRLAECQGLGVVGAAALIGLHSATVGEAVMGVIQYLPYHSPGITGACVVDEDTGMAHLRYDVHMAPELQRNVCMELTYVNVYQSMKLVVAADYSQWEVRLRHSADMEPAAYQRYFDCPVKFGQARDELVFPAALLAMPLDAAGGALRATAERVLDNLMRRFPLDLGLQVENLIRPQLPRKGATIQLIAAQLGLHPRTLQRRLAAQNLRFEDLVDKVRRSYAADLLALRSIPLAEIAYLLGYSEQSTLNRSCLRWFGASPSSLRSGRQRPAVQKPAPE